MGCGSSRVHEDEFYIEATRSVQTSPLMWDNGYELDHETPDHHMMDGRITDKNLKAVNLEMISPDENAPRVLFKDEDSLLIEKSYSSHSLEKDDTLQRSSTLLQLHDHARDSPVPKIIPKEYATQGASATRPSKKKKHSNADKDEGYKSDSNNGLARSRHREIDSDPEHHYHRRRRSRKRPSSVDALVGPNARTRVEGNEKKVNAKRHIVDKCANQAKSSNVSAMSSSTTTISVSSTSSKDSGIRVAGGKHRKGQPPPPWRVHYVQSKPPWMNDFLTNNNDS